MCHRLDGQKRDAERQVRPRRVWLTQTQIITAIKAGKLQCRVSNMYGNPYLRLLRREVETLRCGDVRHISHTPAGLYLSKRSGLAEQLRNKPQSHHDDGGKKGDPHEPAKEDDRADPIPWVGNQEGTHNGCDRTAGPEVGHGGGGVDQNLRHGGRHASQEIQDQKW